MKFGFAGGPSVLRVPINQAKPGMELALPVLQPKRPGVVLLHAGVALDQYEIARMKEIEIREVWIRVPGLEFIAQYINPVMVQRHAELTRALSGAFDSLRDQQHATLEFDTYRQGVAGLVESILTSPRATVFVQELADRESEFIRHASSVSLISLLMGIKLDAYLIQERRGLNGLQAKSVIGLGLGALLHDIGMLRLAPETLDRWNKLRDEKDPAWRRHVQIGFDMLQGHISPTAAAAILHHHQKHDGSGFPARVGLDGKEKPVFGNEIHIFARIIACADLFDRERHTLAGEVPVVRALSRMIRPPISRWIDPMVLRALLGVVPAYAPGTIVRLNTGHRAAVCNWFADDPCRPSVLVLGDEDESGRAAGSAAGDGSVAGRAMSLGDALRATHLVDGPAARIAGDMPSSGDRVDLKSRPDLWITHAQDEFVEADNFYPSYPGEFDLALGGSQPIVRDSMPIGDAALAADAA